MSAGENGTTASLLQVEGISKQFSGLQALRAVSFELAAGSIVGLIGPNGAGKTTLFNIIAGTIRPDVGRVLFDGTDITGWAAHLVARRGIARTFQLTRPFSGLTVLENVTIATLQRHHRSDAARREAERIIELVGLSAWTRQPATTLSTAGRKRLEVARSLALAPSLLLLDEVMAGIVPTERAWLLELLRAIRAEGVTLLLVEHVMSAVMALSDTVLVLHHGELLAHGTPAEVTSDKRVIEAYLGEEETHAAP